jgi:hypothetical protein
VQNRLACHQDVDILIACFQVKSKRLVNFAVLDFRSVSLGAPRDTGSEECAGIPIVHFCFKTGYKQATMQIGAKGKKEVLTLGGTVGGL